MMQVSRNGKVGKMNSVDLTLTPCKRGPYNAFRIEMTNNICRGVKPRRHTPPPIGKVVINKQVLKLPVVDPPDESQTFVATLSPKNGSGKTYRETREVHFWFVTEVPADLRTTLPMDYFRRLIKAEGFPKDHSEFVQRAMLLLQYFPAFHTVEVVIKPAYLQEEQEEIESEEEEEVGVKKLSIDELMRDVESEEEEEAMENFITVLTPAIYDYQYLPEVNVTHKTHVTFRVRAKSNAHVALSSVYGDTLDKTYEIVIGGSDNTKSMIKIGANGQTIKEVMTPNVLSEEELRSFWVSWTRQVVEVGEGSKKGASRFLHWRVPKSKQHSVNCMSVSTGEGATGEWEFVEYIAPTADEATTAEERRRIIRQAMLKEARKRQLLIALEHAFPFTLNMEQLLRVAHVSQDEMMTSVAILKDAETSGLVAEIAKGTWMRSPRSKMDRGHAVCQVYTVGVIGNQHVVSLKLCGLGDSICRYDTRSAIQKIFSLFTNIEHVISVGVAGAVPHFTDYSRHVKLGDVVVSYPVKTDQSSYVHCQAINKSTDPGIYEFDTRTWRSENGPFVQSLKQLNSGFQTDSYINSTIEQYIKDGQRLLRNEDGIVFDRPGPKTDRLYMEDEYGEKIHIEHPKPQRLAKVSRDGQPRIHYGVPAGGKHVACDYQMRLQFADMHDVLCFDGDAHSVLEAVEECGKTSYVVIRGMGDYIDGRRNLDWQPYAALSAAAYMKLLLRHLQTMGRRY